MTLAKHNDDLQRKNINLAKAKSFIFILFIFEHFLHITNQLKLNQANKLQSRDILTNNINCGPLNCCGILIKFLYE